MLTNKYIAHMSGSPVILPTICFRFMYANCYVTPISMYFIIHLNLNVWMYFFV